MEREKAQFQLQYNLTIFHGVEAERNILRYVLLRVVSTQSHMQEGTKEEEKTQTHRRIYLCLLRLQKVTGRQGASEEVVRGLLQKAATTSMTAATPVTAAIWREAKGGKVISVGGNNQQIAIFPYSGPLAVWIQASQLLSFSLSTTSYSFLPTVFPGSSSRSCSSSYCEQFQN